MTKFKSRSTIANLSWFTIILSLFVIMVSCGDETPLDGLLGEDGSKSKKKSNSKSNSEDTELSLESTADGSTVGTRNYDGTYTLIFTRDDDEDFELEAEVDVYRGKGTFTTNTNIEQESFEVRGSFQVALDGQVIEPLIFLYQNNTQIAQVGIRGARIHEEDNTITGDYQYIFQGTEVTGSFDGELNGFNRSKNSLPSVTSAYDGSYFVEFRTNGDPDISPCIIIEEGYIKQSLPGGYEIDGFVRADGSVKSFDGSSNMYLNGNIHRTPGKQNTISGSYLSSSASGTFSGRATDKCPTSRADAQGTADQSKTSKVFHASNTNQPVDSNREGGGVTIQGAYVLCEKDLDTKNLGIGTITSFSGNQDSLYCTLDQCILRVVEGLFTFADGIRDNQVGAFLDEASCLSTCEQFAEDEDQYKNRCLGFQED